MVEREVAGAGFLHDDKFEPAAELLDIAVAFRSPELEDICWLWVTRGIRQGCLASGTAWAVLYGPIVGCTWQALKRDELSLTALADDIVVGLQNVFRELRTLRHFLEVKFNGLRTQRRQQRGDQLHLAVGLPRPCLRQVWVSCRVWAGSSGLRSGLTRSRLIGRLCASNSLSAPLRLRRWGFTV